jgi:Trk K+ transport system NAD-binding subunit
VPRIIALASTRRQIEILKAIGASRVLNPVEESAVALADNLTDPGRGDTWSITSDDQVGLVPLPSSLVGQPVRALEKMGVTLLLLAREGEVNTGPALDSVLAADDLVLVHGTPLQVLNFRRLA